MGSFAGQITSCPLQDARDHLAVVTALARDQSRQVGADMCRLLKTTWIDERMTVLTDTGLMQVPQRTKRRNHQHMAVRQPTSCSAAARRAEPLQAVASPATEAVSSFTSEPGELLALLRLYHSCIVVITRSYAVDNMLVVQER